MSVLTADMATVTGFQLPSHHSLLVLASSWLTFLLSILNDVHNVCFKWFSSPVTKVQAMTCSDILPNKASFCRSARKTMTFQACRWWAINFSVAKPIHRTCFICALSDFSSLISCWYAAKDHCLGTVEGCLPVFDPSLFFFFFSHSNTQVGSSLSSNFEIIFFIWLVCYLRGC